MKKLFLLPFSIALLAGCQSTTNEENSALRKEIENLKSIQRQIAIKVGLGGLVRPDKIELSSDGIWLGSPTADIVMIEYTDLNCPFCKKFQQTVWPEFKEKFVDSNEVAVIARELPLASLHPKAPYAAVMLRCADAQGKYEPVKNKLFELGNNLMKENITEIVTEFELDKEVFEKCTADTSVHNIVTNSIQEATELGLASTPTFIIGQREGNAIVNYTLLTGAGSIEAFSEAVEKVKTAK